MSTQALPYDTTMLYGWLKEVGIGKIEAQSIFEFDAVYDKFPGFSVGGGHLAPTIAQMDDYFQRSLGVKIKKADKVIVLGNVAKNYLLNALHKKDVIYLMHPSLRNHHRYTQNKDQIIGQLKSFLKPVIATP